MVVVVSVTMEWTPGGGGAPPTGAAPLRILLLSPPVAREMRSWSLTCRAMWRAWRDTRESMVRAVDVGTAPDGPASAVVARHPRVSAVAAAGPPGRPVVGPPGEPTPYAATAVAPRPRDTCLVHMGLQAWPSAEPVVTSFSFVGAPTTVGSPRDGPVLGSLSPHVGSTVAVLKAVPYYASLRRLSLAVGPPTCLVSGLLSAVGAALIDLTVLVNHDWGRDEPLERLLAGAPRTLQRLALNFSVFGAAQASWLVNHFPRLEVLHLLSSFRVVDAAGNTTVWCHELDYDYVDVGAEADVVQDDALGILATGLRLEELVVSACVEPTPFPGLPGDFEEPTPVIASPSIDAVEPALAALAPTLRRFGLASCDSMGPMVDAFPPLPLLTGLRLDWSTCNPTFRDVRLLPAVTALARAGHLPRLMDLTLCVPAGVDSGGRPAVAQLNRLTSVQQLRLVGTPHTAADPWATTVLDHLALPRLTGLVVEVAGTAPLNPSVTTLRRRCRSLASVRIHGAAVGLALLQALAVIGLASTFVRCKVLPGVTHRWVRHEPLLRFLL